MVLESKKMCLSTSYKEKYFHVKAVSKNKNFHLN